MFRLVSDPDSCARSDAAGALACGASAGAGVTAAPEPVRDTEAGGGGAGVTAALEPIRDTDVGACAPVMDSRRTSELPALAPTSATNIECGEAVGFRRKVIIVV